MENVYRSNASINKVHTIISNLKKILGLKNDYELAEKINVQANTLSSWRQRGSVPYSKIIELCFHEGIQLELIFFYKVE